MGTYKLIEIKLTPITPYFFGKEPFHQLGNKTDYYQTSLDSPQQTTLLGLLRHKILRDNKIDLNKLAPKNPSNLKVEDLIGKRSFQVNDNNFNCFGKIHSISPCYIVNPDEKNLFFENSEFIEKNPVQITGESNHNVLYHGDKPYLSKHFFDEKIGCDKKDDIIHSSPKVSIYKGGVKTVSTKESYFIMEYKNLGKKYPIGEKQEFHKFERWSFGFQALIASDFQISELDDIMEMGKERSLFKVKTQVLKEEIGHEDNTLDTYSLINDITTTSNILKCVLLSDTKVSEEEFESLKNKCVLQITNKQRVRYIKRKTENYYLGAKPIKENKAFNLISKGSVLFIKESDKKAIMEILDKAKDFKQIGYNYYYFKNAK